MDSPLGPGKGAGSSAKRTRGSAAEHRPSKCTRLVSLSPDVSTATCDDGMQASSCVEIEAGRATGTPPTGLGLGECEGILPAPGQDLLLSSPLFRALIRKVVAQEEAVQQAVGRVVHLEADLWATQGRLVSAIQAISVLTQELWEQRALAAVEGLRQHAAAGCHEGEEVCSAVSPGRQCQVAETRRRTSGSTPAAGGGCQDSTSERSATVDTLISIEDKACGHCLERDAVSVVLPCRHLALCSRCDSAADACPTCGGPIQATLQLQL